jgi:hypothetical protein
LQSKVVKSQSKTEPVLVQHRASKS